MDCKNFDSAAALYLDRELDAAESLSFESHLAHCDDCRKALTSRQALSAQIRREASYHRAPDELARRVQAELRPGMAPSRTPLVYGSSGFLAGAAICAVVAFAVIPRGRPIVDELVADHVRSLMVNHLADVASSDQHTVKPWFNGKLDYAPPVEDLTGKGFPLVGGRLDYVQGQTVAALSYRHRLHVINVFIWPESGRDEPIEARTERGYHLLSWRRGALRYWAVSDLNPEELDQLARLLD